MTALFDADQSSTSQSHRSRLIYPLGLGLIWLFAVALRFWGLERFNTLVFDEIYYVKFADQYLRQVPLFDGHPPLSKYIIAATIWFAEKWQLGPALGNDLAGSFHTTWSYRWSAALTGSLIPIVTAELVRQISRNVRFALIAGSFITLDGLFLVESRYGLNNVYLVIFGLIGQLGLVLAARSAAGRSWHLGRWQMWGWLCVSGIGFAASASVKWNGLWFLLGGYGVLGLAWGLQLWRWAQWDGGEVDELEAAIDPDSILERLGRLNPIAIALCLGLLPWFFYVWTWGPHLALNPTETFWGLQEKILTYHQNVKSGKEVHPYCSDWLSWLLMQQPVAYFYQRDISPQQLLPTGAVVKPDGLIYAVHAMGNPPLWWAATAAIGGTLLTTIGDVGRRLQNRLGAVAGHARLGLSGFDFGLATYLLVNYLGSLLPWMRVTRCIFLYHYMGASIFSMVALAWWCDRAWSVVSLRPWVIGLGVAIGLGFGFWLPVYLGLPLSAEDYAARMWSKAWICGANCQ
jgi:dolichyl-phosphate-mannose--protein O-mannosyl transferase